MLNPLIAAMLESDSGSQQDFQNQLIDLMVGERMKQREEELGLNLPAPEFLLSQDRGDLLTDSERASMLREESMRKQGNMERQAMLDLQKRSPGQDVGIYRNPNDPEYLPGQAVQMTRSGTGMGDRSGVSNTRLTELKSGAAKRNKSYEPNVSLAPTDPLGGYNFLEQAGLENQSAPQPGLETSPTTFEPNVDLAPTDGAYNFKKQSGYNKSAAKRRVQEQMKQATSVSQALSAMFGFGVRSLSEAAVASRPTMFSPSMFLPGKNG